MKTDKRKPFGILVLLVLALLCAGCSNQDHVRLCDYRNMRIPSEVLEVSEEDIRFSVQMQLTEKNVLLSKPVSSSFVEEGDVVSLQVAEEGRQTQLVTVMVGNEDFAKGFDDTLLGKQEHDTFFFEHGEVNYTCHITDIKIPAENLTDDLAKAYFDCSSAEEVFNKTREEIAAHRAFDYVYLYLLENSMLRNSGERRAYIQRTIDRLETDAEANGCSLDVYLDSVLGTTLGTYKQMAGTFYDEYLILEALMDQEGIEFSEEAFDDSLNVFAEDLGITADEALLAYGEEVIRYIMYYEKSYSILLQYAER